MKQFESFMAQEFEEYLLFRQNTGRDIKSVRSNLHTLDGYLKDKKVAHGGLDPLFFLELRERLGQNPRTVNAVFSSLRGFYKYLVRKGNCAENPVKDIPPLPCGHFIPFVFTAKQTDTLLTEVCRMIRKDRKNYLKDMAVYIAVLLMARCGLRISEPVKLKVTHYRPEEKTIYIEKTKFKKDRLIPVPMAAAVEIENYISVRETVLSGTDAAYLLTDDRGNRLSDSRVRQVFHQAVARMGMARTRRIEGGMTFGSPTPHSLRHSFAVNTLKQIKERGKAPQQALPVLASYMGHRKYKYTGSYLKVSDANDIRGLINFAAAHRHSR